MKIRKKPNSSEESYWKSFTDIMTGLLLIILLVLMLLLLLLTQMNDEEHTEDYQYETVYSYGYNHLADEYYKHDHDYDYRYEHNDSGGGGGGGGEGVDDPGKNDNEGQFDDVGHDKTAVFVTAIDKETGNVIKKEGILFELYANRNAEGGLLKLHTYYPEKQEYKEYQTTESGTFYLPEKITRGWYSLHNLKAPEGYGIADDVSFEIDEALDWSDPFLVDVPMEPAKGIIYIQNIDSDTKEKVGGGSYAVFAAEDIITLDGTLRYKSGEKVNEFTCDENGSGQSAKLYLGSYIVKQTDPPTYYALTSAGINVTVEENVDTDQPAHNMICTKTKVTLTLTDEYTQEPIKGAEYSVTDKENVTTDAKGTVVLTDLDKNKSYTLTPVSVPDNYRISEEPYTFKVDSDGTIGSEAAVELAQTAYMIRLSADVKDMIFKNSVTGNRVVLYDSSDAVAEEWEAVGSEHLIEGLEPGLYTLEVDNSKATRVQINLKDSGALQTTETMIWTLWDTIAVVVAIIVASLLVYLVIRIVHSQRKKKANGSKE